MKPQDRRKLKEELSRGHWFRSLPGEMQDGIVDRMVLRSFEKGQAIAAQGSAPGGLHVVLEGRVAWRRTTESGDKLLLYVAGPGAWFGHLSLIRRTPMQFEVVAHSDARTLLLPHADYVRLVDENAGYYERIADQALERFELLIRLYSESLTLATEDLIPARLATLAEMRRAESGQRGCAVELKIAQGDLAAMIGVSRQTLNMALKRLEADGLVEPGFGRLRIPEPARLARAKRLPAQASSRRGKRS